MRNAWMIAAGAAASLVASGALWLGCSDDAGETKATGSCQPSDPSCPAVSISSDCLALVDNSGKDRFALRLGQLSVSRPAALQTPIVYNLVADGININLPQCNVDGKGTFSFVAEFDKASGTIRAGSAVPEADPTAGFCYVVDSSRGVGPVVATSNLNADGSFNADPIPKIVIPVFLDLMATSAVYLPLTDAVLEEANISADQNCIGRFNAENLDPAYGCVPDPRVGIEYFVNGGSLRGHITLEEADAVLVEELNQSLCVLLSGSVSDYGDGGDPVKCKRDASNQIAFVGDWCSATNSEGGCGDAMRLEAGFAASAVELRSDCPGDPTGSGGGGGGGAGGGGMSGAGGAGGN